MTYKMRRLVRKAKKTGLAWRFGTNLVPTVRFLMRKNGQTGLETEIVRKLDADGIASVSVHDLDTFCRYDRLERYANELLTSRNVEVSRLKEKVNEDPSIGQKSFNLEMLGSELSYDAEDIFARFALSPSFLNIANSYFRMLTRLRYYNIWYTAASSVQARESQLWHFDREDRRILKVFLYLNDVDNGSGPFTYAPATHKKGQFGSIAPAYFDENGVRRTTDEQMAAVYPVSKWNISTGKAGTVIFADTSGFHKGGEARTNDRLMFTCMYTSPASESKQLLHVPRDLNIAQLTTAQLWALGLR